MVLTGSPLSAADKGLKAVERKSNPSVEAKSLRDFRGSSLPKIESLRLDRNVRL